MGVCRRRPRHILLRFRSAAFGGSTKTAAVTRIRSGCYRPMTMGCSTCTAMFTNGVRTGLDLKSSQEGAKYLGNWLARMLISRPAWKRRAPEDAHRRLFAPGFVAVEKGRDDFIILIFSQMFGFWCIERALLVAAVEDCKR